VTGSPSLLRVESPGLRSAIHRLSACRIPAGVIWVRSPGRAALGLSHWIGQPPQLPGRTPVRPWPPGFGRMRRGGLDTAAKHSASEMWCTGMAGISFVVSLGRGGRPRVLYAGQKLLSHRIPSKAPWASMIGGPAQAASGDRVKGSTSNGVWAAFHVEPSAAGPRRQWFGKTSPLKVVFLPGWGRSFLMRDSEYLIQPGRVHLRVIACRWPFWTSMCLGFELSRGGVSARILAQRAATTRPSGSVRRTHDSH